MGVISGAGGLGFGAAFVLRDAFSRTSDKIERKFRGLENTTDKASKRISGGMMRMQKGFKQLALGAVILAPLALGINEFIKYETAFTGVRKTVELSEPGFAKLESNIRNMAKTIPVSAVELSGIGEIAGQLGVKGVDNLTKFISTVAMIKETTNLSAEDAATSFARIANIMQEPIDNVDRMASSVVFLGNNFATTESEIVGFATRIAGATKIAGISAAHTFGIGAAFTSVGVAAEAGGTSVQKVLLRMTTAVATGNKDLVLFAKTAGLTTQAFTNLTPIQRFQSFVEGLALQGNTASTSLDELKLRDQRLQRAFLSLAGAGDLLSRALEDSNKAFLQNTALAEEADKRFSTFASKLAIVKNIVIDLFISIGEALKPALAALIFILKPIVTLLAKFAQSKIGKFIIGLAAAIGVVIVAIGLWNIVMGAASVAAGIFMTAIAPLLPILLPLIAIFAAIAIIVDIAGSSMESFRGVMTGGEIKGGFAGFMQKLGGVIMGAMAIWRSATTEGFSLTVKMRDAFERLGILEFILALGTWIVRLKAFFGGVWQGIKVVFGFVAEAFAFLKGVLKSAAKAMDDAFGTAFTRMFKSKSKVEEWIAAGKIVGIIVGVVMVGSFISLAIAVLAATWPILLIIGIVIAVIAIIKNWGAIVDWISAKWTQFVNWLISKFMQIGEWFLSLPMKFFNFGKSIVLAIRDGIKNAWASLKTWVAGLIDGLIPDFVKDFFSDAKDIQANISTSPAPVTESQLGSINDLTAANKGAAANSNVNVQTGDVIAQAGNITVKVELDGDQLAEAAANAESLEDSRE